MVLHTARQCTGASARQLRLLYGLEAVPIPGLSHADVPTLMHCVPQRNTDGNNVNLFKADQPVSFLPAVGAPRLTFAAISVPDLASRQPRDDPLKPSGTGGQPDLPVSPGQAVDAVSAPFG